eukprot:COSAG05_NODE_151_length_15993_cov_1413.204039_7_plen_167_part_00
MRLLGQQFGFASVPNPQSNRMIRAWRGSHGCRWTSFRQSCGHGVVVSTRSRRESYAMHVRRMRRARECTLVTRGGRFTAHARRETARGMLGCRRSRVVEIISYTKPPIYLCSPRDPPTLRHTSTATYTATSTRLATRRRPTGHPEAAKGLKPVSAHMQDTQRCGDR